MKKNADTVIYGNVYTVDKTVLRQRQWRLKTAFLST